MFFWNENFFISQKISSVGSSEFQKELQVLDQPNFFDIFWKNLQVLDQVQTF